jgi:hypothetical protein
VRSCDIRKIETRSDDMSVSRLTQPPRELAYRTGDGMEVTLYWRPDTDELSVCVCDHRRGAYFVVSPEHHLALDVFYHPYSYVSASEVHYEDERLAA